MIDKNRQRPTRQDLQPDPQLKLSSGRANWLQMTLVAAACAFILGLMIYGLNQPERDIASTPGTQTTGTAPQQEQPQTGGNTAGGKNVDQTPPAAQQPSPPAQQPAPEQTKPATPDDSKR